MYRLPATSGIPLGGPETSEYDWVEYQIVVPRCPDRKGRSCLKGTEETVVMAVEVDEDGITTEGVDRSKVRALGRVS
jgi:hypothetical protein